MNNFRDSILFISHYSLESQSSGPKVRSINILKELNKRVNVLEVHGTSYQRFFQYCKFFLNSHSKFCNNAYIEASSSFPGIFDLIFIFFLKIKGTYISIYIRDAYPKFKYFWGQIKLHQYFYYIGWYFSIWIYKKCSNILYFPTKSLLELFDYENSQLLQAGLSNFNNKFSDKSKNLLYVGNINEMYGDKLLFIIIEKIRKVDKNYKLFIVNNKLNNSKEYRDKGIIIINKNFESLQNLQKRFIAAFCCLNPKVEYSHFCLPLKIFDSFNWGLPVIATNCREINQFITSKNVGMIINKETDKFIDEFLKLINNKTSMQKLHNNVCNLHNDYKWLDRADKILKRTK